MEIKLTRRQRQVVRLMTDRPGCYLAPTLSVSGRKQYRLHDTAHNPVSSVRSHIVGSLRQKDYLIQAGTVLVLHPLKTIKTNNHAPNQHDNAGSAV